MCGRYSITTAPEAMRRLFNFVGPLPNLRPRYNVAPTQDLPVVRYNPEARQRSLDLLRWGLIPRWAKDPSIGAKLINARADGVATKPSFRDAFRKRRCLIPSDAFYEWAKNTKPKQPYAIRLKGRELFALAGLWEGWRNVEGDWLRTFTIITTDANELVAPIHNRMPVILDPSNYAVWLGEVLADDGQLLALLKPFPASKMEAHRVGLGVNRVANDDASLLEPVA